MLTTRNLIFGSQALYWECYDLRTTGFLSHKLLEKPSLEDWYIIIENYTCRNLTNERDKLLALAGLASLYGKATGNDYICDLWKQTLLADLLWIHAQGHMVFAKNAKMHAPKSYRAPSWSWASVNGTCYYKGSDMSIRLTTEVFATFSDSAQTTLEGDEWLSLRGPLIRAEVKGMHMHFGDSHSNIVWVDPRAVNDLDGIDPTSDPVFGLQASKPDAWALLLGLIGGEAWGLVLVEVVDFSEGYYKWFGMFRACLWLDSFCVPKTDLTLI